MNKRIEQIPISEIQLMNYSRRKKAQFQQVLSSIRAVGLKKPIIVAKHQKPDATKYNLVCGEARMEALLAMRETSVPAIVLEASPEDQMLIGLVENIARQPPSNRALLMELRRLRQRNYRNDQIAQKLGLPFSYVQSTMTLLEHGEEKLVEAVERGHLPLELAVKVANENTVEVQKALSEAYDQGELRGNKLLVARQVVARRLRSFAIGETQPISETRVVAPEYCDCIPGQHSLIKKAKLVREHLLLLIAALRRFFADQNFVAILRAEGIRDVPEQLAARLKR